MKKMDVLEYIEGGACSNSTIMKLAGLATGAALATMTVYAGPFAAPMAYTATAALYACIF